MSLRYMVPAFVLATVLGGAGYLVMGGVSTRAYAENTVAAAPAVPTDAKTAITTPTEANPVIAEVAGEKIHKADIEQLYSMIKERAGTSAPPVDQIFWMLVDQVVASRLVVNEAKKENLQVTPEVQNAMKMAQEQILQEAYVRNLFKGLDDEKNLRPYYDKLVSGFKAEKEVHARHILVKTEAEAKDIIKQLNGGADFAKIAKDKSEDPGSKANGGDLGFFSKGAMVPEFAAVAFSLEPGKITPTPVKTQFGYHVIKVEEVRDTKPPTFEESKAQLLNEAQQDKLQMTLESLRKNADVKLIPAEGVPPPPATKAAAPESAPAVDKTEAAPAHAE